MSYAIGLHPGGIPCHKKTQDKFECVTRDVRSFKINPFTSVYVYVCVCGTCDMHMHVLLWPCYPGFGRLNFNSIVFTSLLS